MERLHRVAGLESSCCPPGKAHSKGCAHNSDKQEKNGWMDGFIIYYTICFNLKLLATFLITFLHSS